MICKFKVVNGSVSLKDETANGQIRLKGDRVTHFEKESLLTRLH